VGGKTRELVDLRLLAEQDLVDTVTRNYAAFLVATDHINEVK
jgi:hypothetical protein